METALRGTLNGTWPPQPLSQNIKVLERVHTFRQRTFLLISVSLMHIQGKHQIYSYYCCALSMHVFFEVLLSWFDLHSPSRTRGSHTNEEFQSKPGDTISYWLHSVRAITQHPSQLASSTSVSSANIVQISLPVIYVLFELNAMYFDTEVSVFRWNNLPPFAG